MKIRILLAALAVSIFAAGCAKTKTPEPTPATEYTITLTDDGHGTATATVGNAEAAKAKEGDLVTVTVAPSDLYVFKQWVVVSGGVTLSSATTATATFTMPANAVEIKAEFRLILYPELAGTFPDETFRVWVVENCDTDDDGKLSEAEAVTSIDVSGSQDNPGSIASLAGIEHFTELTYLSCDYNQLTSLDISNNPALAYLYCRDNQFTTLDISNNPALIGLGCDNNRLTELDVSKNTGLTSLICSSNQLTSLDVSSNIALDLFWCSGNQLTKLDVSKNTELTWLECKYNPDLAEILLATGQTIETFNYPDTAEIKYK